MRLIGKVLSNRYEIIEEIGVGGMAYVYKAKCKLLNRNVAVKVLKEEFSKDDTFVRRFRSEAQAAASLTHHNIVSVYDVGEEDGINYIVMELLESRTLKDYIQQKGVLSSEETLKISMQIASGLEAAHKEKIVHRDIKPQNIVLSKNLVVKVTDFGIAKASTSNTITNFGTTMGSVHYFSPEHAKGGYTDEKSDIYSLGVVMYEMATGRVPFDSDSPVSVALKHIQEQPVEPIEINVNIPESLNNIILKAMSKNTSARYKNANEMLNDINEAMNNFSRVSKRKSSVEAGRTQVIPVVTDEMIEENIVPNLRTRTPRRMSVISSRDIIKNEKNTAEEKPEINKEVKQEKIGKKNKAKNKKILIISIILFVIVLSVITVFVVRIVNKIKVDNNKIEVIVVPDLVGKNYEEVKNEYVELGIEIIQQKLEFSSEVEEGHIISQNLEAGLETPDKKINVVVSRGQRLVKVPDVTGKDIRIARYELEDTLGFVIDLKEEINAKVLANIVISQEPGKDTELSHGSTVTVVVSKGDGKARIIMPSVMGNTEDVAKKTLSDLKLTVNVKYEEDNTKPNGIVLTQSYPQNHELKEGDLVEITVNKLLITKTVLLNLTELKGTNEYEEDGSINVKVIASVDGSPSNTVFDRNFSVDATKAEFTINGYNNASLKIYLDGKEVKTQTINFKE